MRNRRGSESTNQRINESTNQRINEAGNVHESRHCGMVLAAIQRFWVVGWGSSIRLFVYSSIRLFALLQVFSSHHIPVRAMAFFEEGGQELDRGFNVVFVRQFDGCVYVARGDG